MNGRQAKRRPWSPESSDTDSEVGDIPMPADTPPPVPRRRWEDGERRETVVHALPDKVENVVVPSQAVYESKPVLRDLRKEAAAFVPAAVRKRLADGEAGAGLPVPVRVDDGSGVRRTDGVEDKALQMVDVEFEDELKQLEQADVRWRQEAKQATVEDVADEDA